MGNTFPTVFRVNPAMSADVEWGVTKTQTSDPENSDPENSDPLKFKFFSIIFTYGHLMFIGKSHNGATYLCLRLIAVASTEQ